MGYRENSPGGNAMRQITKAQIAKILGKDMRQLINLHLFNFVLKGFLSFDFLTIQEKKTLIRIPEGRRGSYRYDPKLKQIAWSKRIRK